MYLISPDDILSANKNLKYFGGRTFARFMLWLLRLNRFNREYAKYYVLDSPEFLNKTVELFGIKYIVSEEDLKKIPETGPFITVSNHPTGGSEGIALIKMMTQKRTDYKFLVNFLLTRIKPLDPFFLPVNPFENHKDAQSSMTGIKNALNHIREGNSLGIFPAGEVSALQKGKKEITDREWQVTVLKLIKKAQVPVVPIYIEGKNSWWFYFLGRINPVLRTAKLPSELLNKKKQVLRFRIGKPISVNDQNLFEDISEFGNFLRMKTYTLGADMLNKRRVSHVRKVYPISGAILPNILVSEVDSLGEDHLLFRLENYRVFHARAERIPSVMHEIARLREYTYREIGEGTYKKLDTDAFDQYFNHLFIWDDDAKKIVGAYRMGKGKEIMQSRGIKGFYIESLFRINEKLYSVLEQSIELGRSFICKEYQRKALSLFLLWKGILYFLIKNPEYRYLIGPVSISDACSDFSKGLILEFLKAGYFNEELAVHVNPRTPFKYKVSEHIDTKVFLKYIGNDINRLDKFIHDVEPDQHIPVLFKKYIKQNARILGANVDPKFNYCIDVLMLLDLKDVPTEVIESLSKDTDTAGVI